MEKLKFIGSLLLIGALIYLICVSVVGYNKEKDTQYVAEEYFNTINEYRVDNNLPALKWDQRIFEYAVAHSEWMNKNNILEHSHNGFYEAIMTSPGGHLDMTKYLIPEFVDEYENGEIVERKTYLMIKPWIDSNQHNEILLSRDIYSGAIGVAGDYVTFMAR